MAKCIHYTGRLTSAGYGRVRYKGRMQLVHRLAYCESNGVTLLDIKGKVIRHTCDNPKCINPEHLLIGTQADNVQDMMQRQRHVSVRGADSPNTHLTPTDVITIRKLYKRGSRKFGGCALGRLYNTSDVTIANIVNGKTWSSV